MQPPADVAQRHATAMAVAVRRRLLCAVADGPLSREALAQMVGSDEETVVRDLEPLVALGVVEYRDGRYGRREHLLTDGDWATLPLAARRDLAAGGITQIHVAATAAVDAGGFDRDDMHLTHSPLVLDEERWRRAAAILEDAFYALQALAAEEPQGPELRATAAILLHTDQPAPESPGGTGPLFSEGEGRERAVELAEAIQQAATAPSAPWLDLVALADELRVVARAASLARSDDP